MPDKNQVQQVLRDPNFYSLPIGERTKVLSRLDQDFAALPSDEQLKVVNRGIAPSTQPATQPSPSLYERFQNAMKPTPEQLEGAKSYEGPESLSKDWTMAKSRAVLTGKGILGSVGALIHSPYDIAKAAFTPPQTPEEIAVAAGASGNPLGSAGSLLMKRMVYDPSAREFAASREAAEHQDPGGVIRHAAGTIPILGPWIANRAEEIDPSLTNLEHGAQPNPWGGVAGLATDVLAPKAAGELAGKVGPYIENRRILTGTELGKKALNIPAAPEAAALAGRTAPEAVNLAADFDRARFYLADIDRTMPVNGKGSAATFQRAKNTLDYADELWERTHNYPISRQGELPINSQDVAQAGMDAITPEAVAADPRGAGLQRRLQNWLQQTIAQPRNLQSADAMVRELNADLNTPRAQQAYGPLDMRVRQAVVGAYRNEIDRVLTDAGEQGVKESNQDWGAVNNIGKEMVKSAIREAASEGRAGLIPDWVHGYIFRHFGATGLPSIGVSVNPAGIFQPTPSSQLASGMAKLGRSQLAPPPTMPPPPRMLPFQTGPDTSGPMPNAVGPSAYSWNAPGAAPPNAAGTVEATGRFQAPNRLGSRGQGGQQINVLPTEHPGEGNYAGLLPGPPAPFTPPAPMPQVGGPPTLGFPPTMPDPMWTPRMGPSAPTWDVPDATQPATTPAGAAYRRLLLLRPVFPQSQ